MSQTSADWRLDSRSKSISTTSAPEKPSFRTRAMRQRRQPHARDTHHLRPPSQPAGPVDGNHRLSLRALYVDGTCGVVLAAAAAAAVSEGARADISAAAAGFAQTSSEAVVVGD